MSPIVPDCSVVIAWLFKDEYSAYSERVLKEMESRSAWVPSIWPLEIANTIAVAERRGRVTQEDVSFNVERVLALGVEIDRHTTDYALSRILSLCRRCGLSAYDAAYLELAQRTRSELATLDRRLKAAAESAGVMLFIADGA